MIFETLNYGIHTATSPGVCRILQALSFEWVGLPPLTREVVNKPEDLSNQPLLPPKIAAT